MTAPMPLTGPNAPDYKSPEYERLRKGWEFIRLIRDINASIREHPSRILPKAEAEGQASYEARVAMTVGFDALDETLHGLVGLALRQDPVLGRDVPPELKANWEDFDLEGNHGAVFTQQVLEFALQDGHCGVLTDQEPAPPGLTLAQEKAMGLRPYAVLVPIDRITAWRPGRLLGRRCLMMLKLQEGQERPSGAFGSEVVTRYRTLYQNLTEERKPFVSYIVHEETKGPAGSSWAVVDNGVIRGPEWIPFRVAYGGERTGILQSRPSLRGLAWSNLEHTQVTSGHAWSLYKTGIAIPVARGRSGTGTLELSSDKVIDVSAEGGFEFAQGAGAALQPAADKIQTIERRMGSQGFSMLRRESNTQQTLGEKEMQSTREESKLARALRSTKDCMEGVLQDMAAFMALKSGGSLIMNRNFSDVSLTADEMRVLIELERDGRLTHLTLLKQLQSSGKLLVGVNVEAEVRAVAHEQELGPLGGTDSPEEPVPELAVA